MGAQFFGAQFADAAASSAQVLASNNERVLLPVNEPTVGSKRKSQILTYLEQHGGEGVQHIALKTDDVFATVHAMRVAVCAAAAQFRAILSARQFSCPRHMIPTAHPRRPPFLRARRAAASS